MRILLLLFALLAGEGCRPGNNRMFRNAAPPTPSEMKTIGDIETPAGYHRIDTLAGSFGAWLRRIHLKKDNRVFLYNGSLKKDQTVQFAVLEMPVGTTDLQQCADAVMRLRAEYLFAVGRYAAIRFVDNNGKAYAWTGGNDRAGFEHYLQNVFAWCGTASLEKQLNPKTDLRQVRPGDVWIKGGFPGHAMIVADVAVDEKGATVFMLAQSYMPAQDIHIVKNPADESGGPWYRLDTSADLVTPEWIFHSHQLRTW